MFIRIFNFNKRAQTTAEYAVLIGLVIAAVLAMQVYVKRALQGRISTEANRLSTTQYEPYYLTSTFDQTRDTTDTSTTAAGGAVTRGTSDRASRTGTQTYGW